MARCFALMACLCSVLVVFDAQAAKTVIVGLDQSNSAPLVTDSSFPRKAAKRVYDIIRRLEYGDTVVLRSFGEYVKRKNSLTQDFHLTRRLNPEGVARSVSKFIAGYGPDGHAIEEEQTTNILGFLENMAAEHPCAEHEVVFVLISDGLEFSELSNAYEIIKTGKGALARLELTDFERCDLEILGFGYGIGPVGVQRLRRAWMAWSKAERFKSRKFLNDW